MVLDLNKADLYRLPSFENLYSYEQKFYRLTASQTIEFLTISMKN